MKLEESIIVLTIITLKCTTAFFSNHSLCTSKDVFSDLMLKNGSDGIKTMDPEAGRVKPNSQSPLANSTCHIYHDVIYTSSPGPDE